jgi:hypothetical protein
MTLRDYVLVVSLHPQDVFTALFFTNAVTEPRSMRVVQYGRGDLGEALAGASAVIVIRGLFEFADVIAAAKAMRIPVFYFIDDNFIVLRDSAGPHARFMKHYSAAAVRDALKDIAGVLASSAPLAEYFSSHSLHDRVMRFPPASSRAMPRPGRDAGGPLRAAFFGGQHLHELFTNCVMPALRRLSRERRVAVTTMGLTEVGDAGAVTATLRPYDVSYARALETLAADGVDLLLHPVVEGLPNNRYKIPHALITAHAIGAIPVVSKLPPYDALAADVAVLADNTESSWYDAIVRAAAADRPAFVERLSAYCASEFGGQQNRDVVDRILSESRPPSRVERQRRRAIAGMYLLRRFGSRAAARLRSRGAAGAVTA